MRIIFLILGVLLVSSNSFQAFAQTEVEAEEEKVLDNPSTNPELYEKTRMQKLFKDRIPTWSLGFSVLPFALRNTDFRSGAKSTANIKMSGISLYGDYVLLNRFGVFSVGAELADYISIPAQKESFEQLFPAPILSLGPYASYQFNYWYNQWVAPTVKGGMDFVYYSYKYQSKEVKGNRFIPKFEAGFLVFLNFLEPSSAGNLETNFDIRRTYLSATYAVAMDSAKTDIDLSDATYKLGVRFEF